jgi:hypothetical protein
MQLVNSGFYSKKAEPHKIPPRNPEKDENDKAQELNVELIQITYLSFKI